MKIIKLNLTKCKVGGVKTSLVNWLSEKSSWFYAMILPLFRWNLLCRESVFFISEYKHNLIKQLKPMCRWDITGLSIL